MAPKTQKLILLRGLPGSSKTTLAKKMVDKDPDNMVMVSADDFFTDSDGNYNFDIKLLKMAHVYCQGMTFYWLSRGKTVVVHNTNIESWQCGPYIETAYNMGIQWEIAEPTTKWRYDVAECAKRNTHGVPEATIQKMFDKWVSTKQLMKDFEKYTV